MDELQFSYVTFDQIHRIQELHPLVYRHFCKENEKFTKFDYLACCPDISNDFPCFFYLTDNDEIISGMGALPDKFYRNSEILRWAWCGAIFTNPEYRGKELAVLLVRNMAKVLHERNAAWAGISSNPPAMRVYQKLKFTIPGYANRYLFPKTITPFLGYYIKNKILTSVLDVPYRMALRIMLTLIGRPLHPDKLEIAVKRVDIDNEDLADNKRPPVCYHTPYHFNDNFDKIKWKINKNKDIHLYLIMNKNTNEHLCYFILKNRKNERAFAGKVFNFKLMTLMDYGVYNKDINAYEALMCAVLSLFWKSDADVLEVISSSSIFNKILKRNGIFKFWNGMSFKFCAPPDWNLDQEGAELSNWPITHFCGDAFSFH